MSPLAGGVGAILMLLGACSGQGVAETTRPILYKCADGRFFTVEEAEKVAQVDYYNEHYRLPRRSSAIGTRYASRDATLIIDGDMAAFATENIVDLQTCRTLRA